jgi:hypothetical protein
MDTLKNKDMKGTWKIHYLGFGVRTLKDSTLNDVIWSLGAQYGGTVYNKAFKSGIITIDEDHNTIVVRPTIQELVDKAIIELL